MRSRFLLVSLLVLPVAASCVSGAALAADGENLRRPGMSSPDRQPIYGSQLMTDEEREEFRGRMRAAATPEERERLRQEHHDQMRQRAAARGISLPEVPPAARGGATRPCNGRMRGPCGAGPYGASSPAPGTGAGATTRPDDGIRYESSGIADDGGEAMSGDDYNLHLVFAEQGSGAYLADVGLIFEDRRGRRIIETDSFGPMFHARLPAGTYSVTASYRGTVQKRNVSVRDNRRSEAYFYWPAGDATSSRASQ